jgi:hypothetical protein
MAAELVMKVKPGGDIIFIYSDQARAVLDGKMKMVRASHVLWHEPKQRWVIRMPDGTPIGNPNGYESRSEAILWEMRILNQMLELGSEYAELGFEALEELEGITPP